MADIIIDGYNLIGVARGNLQKARNNLIEKLSEYSKTKEHKITVVFDGWKDGHAVETKQKAGPLDIIYSRIGEKADLVIKRIMGQSTRAWIVVSSDREISGFANRKDLVSLTSDEFESKLYSSLYVTGNEQTEEDEDDIEIMPFRQKGNPRKLSKKQMKKNRALAKL